MGLNNEQLTSVCGDAGSLVSFIETQRCSWNLYTPSYEAAEVAALLMVLTDSGVNHCGSEAMVGEPRITTSLRPAFSERGSSWANLKTY
jgi:hypothetical protein